MIPIKNIYYDIAMLGKLILLLPFVNRTDFELLTELDIDDKLEEFVLDRTPIYNFERIPIFDNDPCPLETFKALSVPELYTPDPYEPEPELDSTLYMPNPE